MLTLVQSIDLADITTVGFGTLNIPSVNIDKVNFGKLIYLLAII